MHGDTAGGFLITGVGHEDPDLRRQITGAAVEVCRNRCGKDDRASEFDLLSDDPGHVGDGIGHAALTQRGGKELLRTAQLIVGGQLSDRSG